MVKRILLSLLMCGTIIPMAACKPVDPIPPQDQPYDQPHGVIYVPPVGNTPGIGPIFY